MKMKVSNNPLGRPRSGHVTERIHGAVFELLKHEAYNEVTLEAIAEKAGVSRSALYRRYANVGQATLGSLLAAGAAALRMPHTPDLRKDLWLYLNSVASSIAEGTVIGEALRGVLAAALTDPGFAPHFARFIEMRREPVRQRLLEWDGALTPAQLDTSLDLMFGPILYRLLIRRVPARKNQVNDIVDRALKWIAADGLQKPR